EVKAHEILDRLPELGVTEKKTHSSSIDEDVALKLRRLYGFDVPEPEDEPAEPVAAASAEPAIEKKAPAPAAPAAEKHAAEPAPPPTEEKPAAEEPARPSMAPIRPPLSTGKPIHPPIGGVAPRPEPPRPPTVLPP